MNRILFTIFFFISVNSFSQQRNILDKPKVDERVELLSIVFRLADAKEYNSKKFKLYTDKIENHFEKYKKHELIKFVKKIREENGISFDAVMKMAIHLGPAPKFKPLMKVTDSIPDERWGKNNSEKFIKLLKAFYQDAHCKEFFEDNVELYANVSKKFIPVFEHIDLNWYKSFYGKEPKEKFVIVNGLGNGGGNYGSAIVFKNGKREVYAIMGTWSIDSLGMAKFGLNDYFPLLLHEFNHSFVNDIIDKNIKKFENSGEKIYAVVGKQMQNQAYGDYKIMLSEALVRASVIKYMKDHNFKKEEIDEEIQNQLNNGFLWINELENELEKYSNQREKYPTLESYIPNIILAYKNYANNILEYEKMFDKGRPTIISISEFKNFDQNVNSKINNVTIDFDKPLKGIGYSLNYGEKGKTFFPEFGKIKYSEDRKSVVMEVKLIENKEYQFIVSSMSFVSEKGIPIKDYLIEFKTE
jgi:hypothetical protein